MSIFDSDLLNGYKRSFKLWYKVMTDDPYGGYSTTWVGGGTFDGILTEDTSLTATVAGIDKKKNFYGIKVKRDAPLEFKTVFRDVEGGTFYRVTSGDVLDSPKMSAMDMKILSCEEYEPEDWEEPEVTNGES